MDKITSVDEMTILTGVSTLAFVFVIGFMMKNMLAMEEQKLGVSDPPTTAPQKTKPRTYDDSQLDKPTVYIHPLCKDNFEGLLFKTEPGIRTIVILVDQDSKHKLLEEFAKVVYPYARTEAFQFAFLQLEDYLPWYRKLLEETIDYKRKLYNINLKNCIGTVISINGPRKYYCMFHAQAERLARQHRENNPGSFIGMDESDEDLSPDSMKLFESDLLAGFSMWLERLVEGSLKRHRVDIWPNMFLSYS